MDPQPPASEPPDRVPTSPWSRRALVSFAVILVALTGIGVANWLYRPAPPSRLPADPGAAMAASLLKGALAIDTGDLRFATSVDDSASEPVPEPERGRRLSEAAFRLEQAHARHRFDPAIECLLGHVALASDRLGLAERRYRSALALSPRYGEARLGLGITLARRALGEGRGAARGRRLEAIAQLAAVEETDPFYLPALFDRVLLLLEVGRVDEARRLTDRYAALEPGSVWTGALRRRFDAIDNQT